jgi:hypothetical protein
MFECPVCGAELPDGADYCNFCDSELVEEAEATEKRSPAAEANIYEALVIIEKEVDIRPGSSSVYGGPGSPVMEAAHKLQAAHRLHPGDSALHYAWALSLELAGEQDHARNELEALSQADPDFLLAGFAVEGWEQFGESLFRLPPFGPGTKTVHPAIFDAVKKAAVLAVRDRITPRAALFLRDADNTFTNPEALQNAKINLATVISPETDETLIATYAQVFYDPANPFMVEATDLLLYHRGNGIRARYEYLCLQTDIDFVIFDNSKRVLLDKRLPMPQKMLETNQKILEMLLESPGQSYSLSDAAQAAAAHSGNFSADQIEF